MKTPPATTSTIPADSTAPAAQPPASPASTPASGGTPWEALFGNPGASPSNAAAESTPATSATPAAATPPAPTNEVDAYWDTQPAAVQVLRTIPDESQREVAAQQLASQGYSIDVPIMVWGWDPLTTMQARETYGYTWVPSMNQAPVQSAPGIDFPGLTAYDPTQAPTGSIAVSTAFANGLESTDPWLKA